MLKIAEYNTITGEKIDLKELEKYGFKLVVNQNFEYFYFKKVYCNDENDGRIFYTIHGKTNNEFTGRMIYIDSCGDSRLDDTLYDLMKDGLVEKVGD